MDMSAMLPEPPCRGLSSPTATPVPLPMRQDVIRWIAIRAPITFTIRYLPTAGSKSIPRPDCRYSTSGSPSRNRNTTLHSRGSPSKRNSACWPSATRRLRQRHRSIVSNRRPSPTSSLTLRQKPTCRPMPLHCAISWATNGNSIPTWSRQCPPRRREAFPSSRPSATTTMNFHR